VTAVTYSGRVIDLHSHILPGVDDGAHTLDESLALGRAAASRGVTAIAATPHVRADYPTSVDTMEQGVDALRKAFASGDVPVEVLHGGEMEIDALLALDEDTVTRFTIGQTGRYLLVEFPYFGWPFALDGLIHSLRRWGITPLLAHPERNPEIQEQPTRIESAVDAGALVQVTVGSISGEFGRGARRAVDRLLDVGCVHVIASDVHRPGGRDQDLALAGEAVGGGALGRYLTDEAPGSIAAGNPVAPPPRRRARGLASVLDGLRRFAFLDQSGKRTLSADGFPTSGSTS
jgi:protein-tyrosine phosphatase